MMIKTDSKGGTETDDPFIRKPLTTEECKFWAENLEQYNAASTTEDSDGCKTSVPFLHQLHALLQKHFGDDWEWKFDGGQSPLQINSKMLGLLWQEEWRRYVDPEDDWDGGISAPYWMADVVENGRLVNKHLGGYSLEDDEVENDARYAKGSLLSQEV